MKRLLPLLLLWLLALPAHALDGGCNYVAGSTPLVTAFSNCDAEIIEAQKRGTVATTSTNVGNAITSAPVPSGVTAVLRQGLQIIVDSPVTITGAATVNYAGTGAKSVTDNTNTAVGAGDMVLGTRYLLAYNTAGSGTWQLVGGGPPAREYLTSERVYYVRSDGSDSNDGRANTAGGAWLTLQHAWTVARSELDLNGQRVRVNIGAGSFAGFYSNRDQACPNGSIMFVGAGYASTTITPSPKGDGSVIDLINFNGSCSVYIDDVTLDPVADGSTQIVFVNSFASQIYVAAHLDTDGTVLYGTVAIIGHDSNGFFSPVYGGQIFVWGDLRITGNFDQFVWAYNNGYFEFFPGDVTFTGASSANYWMTVVDAARSLWQITGTVTGTPTGPKVSVNEGGQISLYTDDLFGDTEGYIGPTGQVESYVTPGEYTWDRGTVTSGTVTPWPQAGPLQRYVNNGAHTLAAPTTTGNWSRSKILITNGATPGVITTSGWDAVAGTFNTTVGQKFIADVEKINGFTMLTIRPLTTAATGSVTSVATSTGLTGGTITSTGTILFDFAQTLAGNPALGVNQCVFSSTGSGGGFICEGSVADAFEGNFKFPNVTGADSTQTLITDATTAAGDLSGTYPSPTIAADAVALGTDTTGFYALSDAEGGNALDLTCTNCIGPTEISDLTLGTDTAGNYALGDAEGGAATTGDSATAFFSTGALEVARGGTGAAPGADDQVLVSSSTSAASWATIPDSDGATQKLQYDVTTNAFSAGTDDDVPDAGDFGALALTGDVVSVGLATTIQANSVALTTDTTGFYALSDAEGGNALDLTCTDCIGPTEITDLTLGTDTAGNYVKDVADGTGIDGTAAGEGATYTPTLDLTEISSMVWGAGSFTTEQFDSGAADIVATYSNPATETISGEGTSPILALDDQGSLRFLEEDAGGSNYIAFKAPAAITANVTCTLEDDANPIPDSCVGDGTDNTGSLADADYGDIVVSSSGTVWTVDTNSVALTTDTTGNYAAGDAEAGAALTGDSAASFFVTGTLDAAVMPAFTGDVANSAGSLTTTIQADAVALTTDTTGNYVKDVADGTGIDGTAAGEGATYTPTLDLTEINSATFGSSTFTTLVFDAGATDPTWTYASNGVGLTNSATVVFGNATSLTTAGVAGQFQIDGTTAALGSLNINEFNTTDATAFGLNFFKSGNATIGSSTVVASGEDLGRITWYGTQETGTFATQSQAAGIRATVGGTVSSGASGDMPGNLIFCTTADGSGTCTDRLTIDAAGLATFTAGITAAGTSTIGNNALTVGTLELTNNTANTLSAAAGVLSIEGNAVVSASTAAGGDLTGNYPSPTVAANAVALTTDTTGNYAAGTAEAGDALTGDSATAFFSTGSLENAIMTLKTESMCVAASDETTSLTATAGKVTWRMPYAFTLTDLRASITTVATGATLLTVDVNESGTTIISTKLTFDASESTTQTAATPRVISDTALADDAQMSIDVDAIGNTTPGKGLKVCLIGHQ